MVYWNPNDVENAIIGGAIIALSSSLHLLYYGRVTGLSGMFFSVTTYDKTGGFHWKMSFLGGLITIPFILFILYGETIRIGDKVFRLFDSDYSTLMNLNIIGWFLGGFLVGFGTKMGNGCTSGHGVCGVPRFSKRSIAATCTFMATGNGMATLRYYYPFLTEGKSFGDTYQEIFRIIALTLVVVIIIFSIVKALINFELELVHEFIFGLIFGLGLVISGMCRISKVRGFLTLNEHWDPTLAFVMASAVAINLLTFRLIMKREAPKNAEVFSIPTKNVNPDLRLLFGSAIFGIGWGISGLCPGPGIVNMFVLTHAVFWVISMAIGQIAF